MKRTMVRYTVKLEQVARNEELVRSVYDELHRTAPTGLRYATFVQEDGVSFVHVASIETKDGQNPLTETAAFQAFVQDIADRCDQPPVSVGLREVGSYSFWADETDA
jgi:hypothetical protein